MLASNLELLRHIQEECDFIIKYTTGKSKETVLDLTMKYFVGH